MLQSKIQYCLLGFFEVRTTQIIVSSGGGKQMISENGILHVCSFLYSDTINNLSNEKILAFVKTFLVHYHCQIQLNTVK